MKLKKSFDCQIAGNGDERELRKHMDEVLISSSSSLNISLQPSGGFLDLLLQPLLQRLLMQLNQNSFNLLDTSLGNCKMSEYLCNQLVIHIFTIGLRLRLLKQFFNNCTMTVSSGVQWEIIKYHLIGLKIFLDHASFSLCVFMHILYQVGWWCAS